jgi:hypothetical protein
VLKLSLILTALLALLFAPAIFGLRLSLLWLIILLLAVPPRISKIGYPSLLFATLFLGYAAVVSLASTEPSRLYLAFFFYLVLVTVPTAISAIDHRRLSTVFVWASIIAVSIGYLELFGSEITKQAIWYVFKQTSVVPTYSDYSARFIFKHSGMAQNIPASGWMYFMINVVLYYLARDSFSNRFVMLCVVLGLSSIFLMAAGGSRTLLFATLLFYIITMISQPSVLRIGLLTVFSIVSLYLIAPLISDDSEMFHLLFDLSTSIDESESITEVKQINAAISMFTLLDSMNISEWLFGMLNTNDPYIKSDSGLVRLLVQYGAIGGVLYLAAISSHIYQKLRGHVSFKEKLPVIFVVIVFFAYSIKGDFLFGYYSLPGLIFLLNYWRKGKAL